MNISPVHTIRLHDWANLVKSLYNQYWCHSVWAPLEMYSLVNNVWGDIMGGGGNIHSDLVIQVQ